MIADETYTLHYGHVVEPATSEVVDEVLLAVMRKPRSYTREDVVEIHCHGGPAAQRAVLRLLVGSGRDRLSQESSPGGRFLNGRIDLAQAESVAAIVAARSTGALRVSVRQLEGGLSRGSADARRANWLGLLALVEATVDFSDEDVDELDWGKLAEDLARCKGQLRLLRNGVPGAGAARRGAHGHRRQTECGQEFPAQRAPDEGAGHRV